MKTKSVSAAQFLKLVDGWLRRSPTITLLYRCKIRRLSKRTCRYKYDGFAGYQQSCFMSDGATRDLSPVLRMLAYDYQFGTTKLYTRVYKGGRTQAFRITGDFDAGVRRAIADARRAGPRLRKPRATR